MRLSLGLEVGWFKTSYIRGHPNKFFQVGVISIIRKDTVVVRTRYGYELEAPKKDLLVRNMNKPRRDMRGWIPLK